MPKVLVIEDDIHLSKALQAKLVKESMEVTVCSNGREGLKVVKKDSFDIILLDLVMPVETGFEFLDDYYRDVAQPLPIIVLTNLADFSSKMKVYKKGIILYMVKAEV